MFFKIGEIDSLFDWWLKLCNKKIFSILNQKYVFLLN